LDNSSSRHNHGREIVASLRPQELVPLLMVHLICIINHYWTTSLWSAFQIAVDRLDSGLQRGIYGRLVAQKKCKSSSRRKSNLPNTKAEPRPPLCSIESSLARSQIHRKSRLICVLMKNKLFSHSKPSYEVKISRLKSAEFSM